MSAIFRCSLCGRVVEVVTEGQGELLCCQKAMIFLRANITDAAVEKHVPVVSVTDEGVVVKIGSVEHPMATEHFIEWIQLRYSNKSCRFYLRPGGRPEAFFPVGKITDFEVREYCNLHGLWSKEVK